MTRPPLRLTVVAAAIPTAALAWWLHRWADPGVDRDHAHEVEASLRALREGRRG